MSTTFDTLRSPNSYNPELIASVGLFDGAADDFRAFSYRDQLVHALEHTRVNVVSAAGGAHEYLRGGGLSDHQVHTAFFGNFAEQVRNRIEPNSQIHPNAQDPQLDRLVGHEGVQDYAGNSISNFVHGKLEGDSDASRYQVTDQLYERLLHYHGKFEDIIHSHMHQIVPDSAQIGIHTSTAFYQTLTGHSREYARQPLVQGAVDFSVQEIEAIAIYSAYFIALDGFTLGKVGYDSFYNLGKKLPLYALRYTALTEFEILGFEGFGHFAGEQFANSHQGLIAPGLGLVFMQAINLSRVAQGNMEWYQYRRSLFSSSTSTFVMVGVKSFVAHSLLHGAAAGASGGAVAGAPTGPFAPIAIAAGVAAGFITSGVFVYRNYKRAVRYDTNRLQVMIETQRSLFTGEPRAFQPILVN